jgi:hypothetical protein
MNSSFGPSFWLLPLGTWGVLYPPDSLPRIAADRKLIRELAPLQDDLWLKAMSLIHDTPCSAIGGARSMPAFHFDDGHRLWDLNKSRYDSVWNQILRHFALGVDSILLREEALVDAAGRSNSGAQESADRTSGAE